MRILFTGAGSGGHFYPIISVARQLKKNQPDIDLHFLGAVNDLNREVMKKEGIILHGLVTGKLRRYVSFKNAFDILKMPIGLIQALWMLFILMPDAIFSKGGYDSVPVVIVAWLYRIPKIIHEADTVPGLANKIAVKFSKRMSVTFHKSLDYFPQGKAVITGLPIRQELVNICLSQDAQTMAKAKQLFNIQSNKPVVLIMGGSQGAQAINELAVEAMDRLLIVYEIIHQCGHNNYDVVKQAVGDRPDYHLLPFLNEQELSSAYLLASVVVSRAGAASIAEISACHKPSILIPLPESAGDHQRENAFEYMRAGAAIVMDQANISDDLLIHEIKKILDNAQTREKMIESSKKFARTDAAQRIAQELIEIGA